jgi:hypothetical protein
VHLHGRLKLVAFSGELFMLCSPEVKTHFP